jgi:hypothetical protein
MRKTMIQMLEVGDPVTFDDHGEPANGWLRFLPFEGWTALDVTMRDNTVRLVPFELVQFQREATSPVGPYALICEPCGHSWAHHDDSGCLWMVCKCWLPGERK